MSYSFNDIKAKIARKQREYEGPTPSLKRKPTWKEEQQIDRVYDFMSYKASRFRTITWKAGSLFGPPRLYKRTVEELEKYDIEVTCLKHGNFHYKIEGGESIPDEYVQYPKCNHIAFHFPSEDSE